MVRNDSTRHKTKHKDTAFTEYKYCVSSYKPQFFNCVNIALEPAEQLATNLQEKIRDAEIAIAKQKHEAKVEAKNTGADEDFFDQSRQRAAHNLNNEF